MRIIAIIGLALALLNIWAQLSEGKRFRGYGMCRDRSVRAPLPFGAREKREFRAMKRQLSTIPSPLWGEGEKRAPCDEKTAQYDPLSPLGQGRKESSVR
jgi:hypothetical protein